MKKTISILLSFLLTGLVSCQDKPTVVGVQKESTTITPPKLDFIVCDSINLEKISKNSTPLKHGYGRGFKLNQKQKDRYLKIKNSSNMHWAIANCSKKQVIAESDNSKKLVFGASVPKIIIATAAIHNNNGKLDNINQWKQLLQLLVVSANDPQWSYLQSIAGGPDSIISFCKKWNYDMRPEKKSSANLVSANGMVNFYTDLCNRKFVGSDVILKISNACATSNGRSKVFMPDSIIMGGKTGTWSNYIHDTGWFWYCGEYWSIAVLTDGGMDSNDIAIMWGGLFSEYVLGEMITRSKSDSLTSKAIVLKRNNYTKKKNKKKRKSKTHK